MAEFRIPLDYKEKVGRAVHNLDKPKRTTMHPGLLYPLYYRRMKRGEKLVFDTPLMLLQSQPTFAPVMGSYRLRVEWYFNSDANHYGWIDNNSRLTTQEVLNRRHHTFVPYLKSFESVANEVDDYDDPVAYFTRNKYGVGRGSLLDFMGVAPCYQPLRDQEVEENAFGCVFNLDFILTYLNIIRTYHTNQQFPDVPYVASEIGLNGDVSSADGRWSFSTYNQRNLDKLFIALRSLPNGFDFEVNRKPSNTNLGTGYINQFAYFHQYLKDCCGPNGGLFCSQYQPDLYRNLLNNDIDLYKSTIQVNEDGTFSVDTFRFDNRIQKILDRINPFGGKDSTISRTRWGVNSKKDYDQPIYICSHTEYIDTSLITSNNAGRSYTNDGEEVDSIPGSLSGNVNELKFPKKAKQSFTADVPGTLMAIVSLVPLVDYSQNIEHWLLQNNIEDEFSPQMAQRGFEDVPLTDYTALPQFLKQVDIGDSTETFLLDIHFDDVVGKQVAWLHDMTDTPRVHGEFSNYGLYNTWVLSRQYSVQRRFGVAGADSAFDYKANISPYVNPLDWQYPFVPQTLKDPNFYFQCLFDVKTVSPVGYRFMPTLEQFPEQCVCVRNSMRARVQYPVTLRNFNNFNDTTASPSKLAVDVVEFVGLASNNLTKTQIV